MADPRINVSTPIKVLTAAACLMISVWVALSVSHTGDYSVQGAVAGDNPGPAIDALIHGNLAGFFSQQPLMGLTSILLRVPVAGLVSVLGGGSVMAYRLGALVCVVPGALLASWMIWRTHAAKDLRPAAVLAAIIVLASPAALDAVHIGHPEEVLASVLATGAVLAATRGHLVLTGVLLGLAIGTKQWALLAVPPALLALPERRLHVAALAGVVSLPLTAIAPLADLAAFARAGKGVGGGHVADPFSLWWPLGSGLGTPPTALHATTAHLLPFGLARSAASLLALAIVVGALSMLGVRARRQARLIDALALFALLGLARCAADPVPLEYNFVDVLIPLAIWEAVTLRRLPIVAALATLAVALVSGGRLHVDPGISSALSVTWMLGLAGYLTYRAFAAGHAGGVVRVRPMARFANAGAAVADTRHVSSARPEPETP
jgi:hypothetical protein